MAPKRRPPTPAQRLAKNEADRRRRREHNIEFRGLQDKVLEFQALAATQNNELTRLRAEMANLQDTVQQQREQIHELNRRNQELMALENSVFDLDQFINLFEEAPNNEPATDGASTSQTGKGFGGAEDPNFWRRGSEAKEG